MKNKLKDIVVVYHGACPDGFGGAWAAWKKLKNKASYIGVSHQAPPPEGLTKKTVYLVDFTYPLPITKKLVDKNKRVTAIDHHVSAEEAVKATTDYSYALDHSGSVLAWNYFHTTLVPRLLRYVEDGDLWKFALPYTREVNLMLDLESFDFSSWNRFAKKLENAESRKKIIQHGKVLNRYEKKIVEELNANAEVANFEGYKTLVVNSPKFGSDLGHLLAEHLPPIAVVWSRVRGQIRVSLRSNGSVDVSKLAEKYGGGGHKAAAGFVLRGDAKLPWAVVK